MEEEEIVMRCTFSNTYKISGPLATIISHGGALSGRVDDGSYLSVVPPLGI